MVASISNPADLANNALIRMGYKMRVGSLFDGSAAARHALQVYAQTRDEMLRAYDYDFAERTIALTLLKSAPIGGYIPPRVWTPATDPPLGFAFEYAFPDDCLKVRAVKRTFLFLLNPDPQPNAFQISNDNAYTPARRVVLCNIPDAMSTYTGQITDPATWDVAFVDLMAAALGRRLAPGLVGIEGAKMEMADEQNATPEAQMDQR